MSCGGRDGRSGRMCLLGVDDLDAYLGEFPCRGLLVVLGHPGAGKTTLACQLVHANAVKLRRRALYITLYEGREALVRNMKSLGIDLEDLERKGLLRIIHLPVLAAPEAASEVAQLVYDEASKMDADIVVIDGVTPILEGLTGTKPRAFLHSVLYRMAHSEGRLVVAVADLPWGRETVGLGGMEFVADAIILVKTRIEHRMLLRWLEVRKFRGKPIPLAEVPFNIVQGRGIVALLPPSMSRVRHEPKPLPHGLLHPMMGFEVPRGTQVLVVHPPGTDVPRLFAAGLAKAAVLSKAKVLIISFSEHPGVIKDVVMEVCRKLGVPESELRRYVSVYGINPAELWVHGVRLAEFELVEYERPSVVMLSGLRVVADMVPRSEFVMSQMSDVLRYKSMGITVLRFYAAMKGEYVPAMEYSDVVVRVDLEEEGGEPMLKFAVLKSLRVEREAWCRKYRIRDLVEWISKRSL